MSAPALILTISAVLVFCGLAQRVLDRLHMSDRMALLLIGLMLIGTFLPGLKIGRVSVNIGGALIPLGICGWVFVKADDDTERWRVLLGSVLTGAAVYLLSRLLPAEAERLPADPNLLYGAAGGVIAWLLGRSRRGAFICGVTGVLLADIVTAIINWYGGVDQPLMLGGAGIADAAVVSGILAVLLCELVGEAVERISRRVRRGENT